MRGYALILLATFGLAGCQSPGGPSGPSKPTVTVHFTPGKLSFNHPATGDLFRLQLGEDLWEVPEGLSAVPFPKFAVRDATASFYEVRDAHGAGYSTAAESLYTRHLAGVAAQHTTIQYQPDGGQLLITEDKSDGLPCRRYILYTQALGGGCEVRYLAPPPTLLPGGNPIDSVPSDVRLLPGSRAEINGKIYRVGDLKQSTHPFSVQ